MKKVDYLKKSNEPDLDEDVLMSKQVIKLNERRLQVFSMRTFLWVDADVLDLEVADSVRVINDDGTYVYVDGCSNLILNNPGYYDDDGIATIEVLKFIKLRNI